MFTNRRIARIGSLTLAAVLLLGCERDNDGPTVNPTIDFLTAQGYTYLDDTVSTLDTLLVGVVIRKGDDGLRTFKVLSTYDGGAAETVDSLSIGSDVFEFDKTIITRADTGTEKWTFWVEENDGDVIRRSLTFTVQ
ncbi:MAG: hypothetical protein KDB84_06100 [Flavobacteriales bacterium]|nr:hypothetical protein [Flavobacteriales bacterium]